MNRQRVAAELVKIAKELTAADPKVTVSKAVKKKLTGKDEKSAIDGLQKHLRLRLPKRVMAWLKAAKLAGWVVDVEVGDGKAKELKEAGGPWFDVSVKVKVTVTFSHSSRVKDAIENALAQV